MKQCLADVNVLLPLLVVNHEHNQSALRSKFCSNPITPDSREPRCAMPSNKERSLCRNSIGHNARPWKASSAR
jgi:hypothetical protein